MSNDIMVNRTRALIASTIFCSFLEIMPVLLYINGNTLSPTKHILIAISGISLVLAIIVGCKTFRIPDNAILLRRAWHWQTAFFLFGAISLLFEVKS